MAKILLALALLVVVAAAFDLKSLAHKQEVNTRTRSFGVCRPQECVKKGAVCDYRIAANVSATTKERWCNGDNFCKVANATTDTTGLCTEYAEVGQACTTSADCEKDLSCVNKFCNRGYLPGAKCKVANDCLYVSENGDITVACNSGKCGGLALGAKCPTGSVRSCNPPNMCGTDGTCVAPGSAGAKCNDDDDCSRATYCANATCATRLAAGASCDLTNDGQQCVDKYDCIPTGQTSADAKCTELFSGANSAPCISTVHCQEGKTCLPKTGTNIFGTCGPTVASSLRACNATAGYNQPDVCSANEQCFCNDNDGTGKCYNGYSVVVGKGAKKAYNSAVGCVGKCGRTDWPCLDKCEGKICSYSHKVLRDIDNTGKLNLGCSIDNYKTQIYPGYVACSAGSFVTFSFFGLVAIVAALLM